jgi:hypothetical protein
MNASQKHSRISNSSIHPIVDAISGLLNLLLKKKKSDLPAAALVAYGRLH